MNIFERKKSPSRVGAWVWLMLLFFFAAFLLLAAGAGFNEYRSEQSEQRDGLWVVFFGIGLIPMLVFVRGAWHLVQLQQPHFLQITREQISFGKLGEVRTISWAQVKQIYWHEGKHKSELAFALLLKDEQVVMLPYADLLLKQEERKDFKSFLQRLHPEISWN